MMLRVAVSPHRPLRGHPSCKAVVFSKWMRIALAVVCLGGGGWTRGAMAEEIRWLRSAEQAANLATQSGKSILVYVRSANCHYCDLMQSNVWQDPAAIAAVNRDFVPLKLTREENPEAVEALQIKGFPSTVIFAADRRYVDRLDGYVEPDRFLKAVGRAREASTR